MTQLLKVFSDERFLEAFCDERAERAVLGAMLMEWDALCLGVQHLTRDSFHSDAYQGLFDILTDVERECSLVDIVDVCNRLEARDQLAGLGGPSFLSGLTHDCPTTAGMTEYIRIVLDKQVRREAARLVQECAKMLQFDQTTPAPELLADMQAQWDVLAKGRGETRDRTFMDVVTAAFGALEARKEQKAQPCLSTGLVRVDNVLGGLYPGSFVVVGGRPGDGKTVLMGNWLAHQAITQKRPTAIFSLEMRAEALAVRIIAWQAQQNHRALRLAQVPDEAWEHVIATIGNIAGAPLHIDDTPALTIHQLCTRAKRMVSKYGVQAIGIDYAQLIRVPGAKDKRLEVVEVTRELQALARQTGVPVVLLSQTGRIVEARAEHRPGLGDFMESSSLEADADQVLAIWHKNGDHSQGVKHLCILKNRFGEGGRGVDVPVYWLPQFQAFRDVTLAEEEASRKKAPPKKPYSKEPFWAEENNDGE